VLLPSRGSPNRFKKPTLIWPTISPMYEATPKKGASFSVGVAVPIKTECDPAILEEKNEEKDTKFSPLSDQCD